MRPSDENASSAEARSVDGPGGGVAARWAARRRDGLTEEERAELMRWLAASPRNALELGRTEKARDELDWPWHAGRVDAVMLGLERRARTRRRRRHVVGLAAAMVMLAIGSGAAWWTPARSGNWFRGDARPLVVREPERMTLPDGSVVETMERGNVAWDFSDPKYRRVFLARGAAHFEVARDPERAFVVQVGGVAVRAVGTAFAVEVRPEAVSVVVTHGRVAIDEVASARDGSAPRPTEAARATLGAGELTLVPRQERVVGNTTAPEVRSAGDAELEQALGWRVPRLEFSGSALAEVIAAMNRHNRVQFVLGEARLGELQVSGALRADRVDALVAILETDWPIRAERRGAEIVLWRIGGGNGR